jgi:glycerol-3-phosphate cytidylyltransferase
MVEFSGTSTPPSEVRFAGDKVYFVAGTWDLFHIGHLNYIQAARHAAQTDRLIVGVNSDEMAMQYKRNPIIPFAERKKIIEALTFPNDVVKVDKLFDVEQLKALHVTTIVLPQGEGWSDRLKKQRQDLLDVVQDYVYLPKTEGISTTIIIERIWSDVIKASQG